MEKIISTILYVHISHFWLFLRTVLINVTQFHYTAEIEIPVYSVEQLKRLLFSISSKSTNESNMAIFFYCFLFARYIQTIFIVHTFPRKARYQIDRCLSHTQTSIGFVLSNRHIPQLICLNKRFCCDDKNCGDSS